MALMESVVSMAGLSNSPAALASFKSSSANTARLQWIRQSDQRPTLCVRALQAMEDLGRSAFGRGAVSSRSTRLHFRV